MMRGQAASADLILSAIALFVLAFTISSFLLAETMNTESASLNERRDRLATAAALQLAQSAGTPENWNESTCERLGLSCGVGVICPEKAAGLSSLYSSNYNLTRTALNLGAYEISIMICNSSSYSECAYNLTTEARELDRLNSTKVSRGEALSSLDGQAVSIVVYAWEYG